MQYVGLGESLWWNHIVCHFYLNKLIKDIEKLGSYNQVQLIYDAC
jgi:hypothetical protein